MEIKRKYLGVQIYLFVLYISILVLGLNYGYYLAVDQTYLLWFSFYKFFNLSSHLLLHMFSIIFSKSFFIVLFVLFSLFSAHYIQKLTPIKYISTLIFLFNPFTYSKIMVGQLGVLAAYLLLPMVFYYTKQFIENKSNQSLLKLVLAITFASTFSIHFFLINVIIIITYYIYDKIDKKELTIKLDSKLAIIGIILLILLNAFWLQGYINNDKSIFQDIDESHEEFFSPKLTHNVPAVAKIIGGWGFWRENAYIVTYKTLPLSLWYLITLLFPILTVIGYNRYKNKTEAKVLFTLFWIGLVLATGISHPYTAPLFNFLFKYIPFFNGFRDSHKFVSLIMLSYAFLIPTGLNTIIKYVQERFKK